MPEINFALALNKPHKSNPEKWTIFENTTKLKKLSDRFFEKDSKQKITAKELHPDKFKFEGVNFTNIETRQSAAVSSITSHYSYIDFIPDWRFIIGLGGASVYDTGITLHHIYGIPYIPATSIKGMLRSWYILDKHYDRKAEMEGYAIQDEVFCRVFGCPKDLKIGEQKFSSALKHHGEDAEFEGNLIFFDAFPLTAPKLKLDVMTPHYQPYYGDNAGKTPPADYFSPVPINFLTVEGTTFRMYFGVKKDSNKKDSNQALLETVKDWLNKALAEKGIGAKTAVGYGYQKAEKKIRQEQTAPPPAILKPEDGLDIVVKVYSVKVIANNVSVTALFPGKLNAIRVENAPKDLRKDDSIKVKCKMRNGTLSSFEFISKT